MNIIPAWTLTGIQCPFGLLPLIWCEYNTRLESDGNTIPVWTLMGIQYPSGLWWEYNTRLSTLMGIQYPLGLWWAYDTRLDSGGNIIPVWNMMGIQYPFGLWWGYQTGTTFSANQGQTLQSSKAWDKILYVQYYQLIRENTSNIAQQLHI